jgi:hypothetical protein
MVSYLTYDLVTWSITFMERGDYLDATVSKIVHLIQSVG